MRLKILLLLLPVLLFAEEEIVVHLPTSAKFQPIYISMEGLPELKSVLTFDLDYNGSTNVVEDTLERRNEAKEPFLAKRWRDLGVLYLIKCAVDGDELEAKLYSSNSSQTFRVPLGRDGMHLLADSIHNVLFGKLGVASSHILYSSGSDVWISDYDGGNRRRLTHRESLCVTPLFLPPSAGHAAGTYFFVSYETGQPKIYAAPLRGGEAKRYISLRGNQLLPSISPRRDAIAFISDAGGNPDLFLQRFSPEVGPIGKPQQIFTAPRAAQASPSFSPDSKRIAFVSNKDGTPRIYLLDLPEAGTKTNDPKPFLITRENRENTSPSWSPDGSKIAFSAMTAGTRQIWIYDVKSGEEKQLTSGPGHKENPAWASNSLHLVFNGPCDLFLVNLKQPNPVKITSGAGEKKFPNWELR